MPSETKPDFYLIGTGVGTGLQLTIEAQRILDRVGKAYALHLPRPLRRYLKSLRVNTVDLTDHFAAARPLRDIYVEVVGHLLDRAAVETPIVVLLPGSPLFLNSVSRLLVLQARKSEMKVEVHLGVSPLEALISYVGLDLSGFGLQVQTADRLAAERVRIDPFTPLMVLELAAAGVETAATSPSDDPDRYRRLLISLARAYPPDHRVTMVNVTGNGSRRSHATLPLRKFAEFVPRIRENSHLFIDAVQRKEKPNGTERLQAGKRA